MTVAELIYSLKRMTKFGDINSDTKIKAYDANSRSYEDITGFLHSPVDNTLELQTDSDGEYDEEEG